jgi:hypothetical protein
LWYERGVDLLLGFVGEAQVVYALFRERVSRVKLVVLVLGLSPLVGVLLGGAAYYALHAFWLVWAGRRRK